MGPVGNLEKMRLTENTKIKPKIESIVRDDIKAVEVMFTVKEGMAVYGYTMQPDDTFIFNATTSIELGWTSAAFSPMFKMLLFLYNAYSRDNNLRDWTLLLNKEGML